MHALLSVHLLLRALSLSLSPNTTPLSSISLQHMVKHPELNHKPKSEILNVVSTGSTDNESGGGPDLLYPKMTEDPKLRCRRFIRKVYAILSVLFTAGVAIMATFLKPIRAILLAHMRDSWAVFLVEIFSPFTGTMADNPYRLLGHKTSKTEFWGIVVLFALFGTVICLMLS